MFRHNWRVVGIEMAYEGLLLRKARELKRLDVSGILQLGGTILGTARGNPFHKVPGLGERGKAEDDTLFVEAMKDLDIDALVCIGGDGTLSVAARLARAGIPVIGVPKTIDNDVAGTDVTFGFDSAVSIVMEALDRLHTTAMSHHRAMVIEVMGRNAGWLALQGGTSSGGDVILMPEIEYSMEIVGAYLKARRDEGKRFSLVVVAEGISRELPPGIPEFHIPVCDRVAKKLSEDWDLATRSVNLGHLQRGGSPTQFDRTLGTVFGYLAVEALADGKLGRMVAMRDGKFTDVPLEEAFGKQRRVPLDHPILMAARAVGTCFGDSMGRMRNTMDTMTAMNFRELFKQQGIALPKGMGD